jgi:hypothetical protein
MSAPAEVAARLRQTARRAAAPPSRQVAARALCAAARSLQIPIDTGRLRASLTVPGHPEQDVTVTQTPAGWGASLASTVPYARYQLPRVARRTLTQTRALARALALGGP